VSAEQAPKVKGPDRDRLGASNRRYAIGAASIAVGMVALSFAAVPFYTLFCRATGYEGTPQRVAAGEAHEGVRTLRVAFDANVTPGLPLRLEPESEAVHIRTGKTTTVFFRAENQSDREIAASATFNVSPELAGAFFDKIQCFCFSEQRLGPHETAEWPVVFFLDPKLETDESMALVHSITLSYTLFAAPGASNAAGSDKRAGPAG
jgi:cytochrome c oxidase assembly protein subunit 11